MIYHNFTWGPDSEATLDNFKQTLMEMGWTIMYSTETDTETLIHCSKVDDCLAIQN